MMSLTKSDLMYNYPEDLVATQPQKPPRVLYKETGCEPQEIAFSQVAEVFAEGDLLVVNQTQVLPRRIFLDDYDILFLQSEDLKEWTVLFPAKKFKVGEQILLPENRTLTLLEKGRPQRVLASEELRPDYFERHGSFAFVRLRRMVC